MTIPVPNLDAVGTALLIIDMQNGFCRPDGSFGRIGFETVRLAEAIAPCRRLLVAARRAALPIIYTRYVYAAGHTDGGLLVDWLVPQMRDVNALVTGTWDAEIIEELIPYQGDVIIDKNRPSAFFRTELDAVLQAKEIEQLIVCGITTNCCVETTVRDASQRDIPCFVVSDATAEFDRARHDGALATMAMLFGWLTDVRSVEAALLTRFAD